MNLLTADQLGEVLDRTRQDLFRIETLPSYDTAMTTGDFGRWLDEEAEPTWEIRQPWLDTLAQWAREGRPGNHPGAGPRRAGPTEGTRRRTR